MDETVRSMLGEFSHSLKTEAINWLAQKDRDERLRNDASQREQIRTALSAKRAAWTAAIAAIVAVVAAIVSIVVEVTIRDYL